MEQEANLDSESCEENQDLSRSPALLVSTAEKMNDYQTPSSTANGNATNVGLENNNETENVLGCLEANSDFNQPGLSENDSGISVQPTIGWNEVRDRVFMASNLEAITAEALSAVRRSPKDVQDAG